MAGKRHFSPLVAMGVIGAFAALGVGCLLRQDLGADEQPTAEPGPTDPAPSSEGRDADLPMGSDAERPADASSDANGSPALDAGALSPAAAEAFDPASCKGAPIGFAGLATLLTQPVPYRIYGRVRDCKGNTCTPWAALPESTVVDQKLGGLYRPAAHTGKVVAGPFNTFKLVSDETCAGAVDPFGSEQCEIQNSVQAVCGYYYAPALGDAGSCAQSVALPYLAGSSSPSCIQMASGYLDPMTGRNYQFAVLVRF